MLVVDMRSINLPFIYLTKFGGVVIDKYEDKQTNIEIAIVHIAVLQPMNIPEDLSILDAIVDVAKALGICSKFRSISYQIVLSGKIPLISLPKLIDSVAEMFNLKNYRGEIDLDRIYVYDPKLNIAANCKLDVLQISEDLKKKLLTEYEEIVRQRLT